MSKNNLANLAPAAKPLLFDPRKKKTPPQLSLSHMLIQKQAAQQGPATQPAADTDMTGFFGAASGTVTPTQPAAKTDAAVVFGAGIFGNTSGDVNTKFNSSKIFGIAFNGGKRIDEDTLKFQLLAVNEEYKAYKDENEELFHKLLIERDNLAAENKELQKQKMEKIKQVSELLGSVNQGANSTDPASQNTSESNVNTERLKAEKRTLTNLNRRMNQNVEDLKKEIDDLKNDDQSRTHVIQALEDVVAAEKMCRASDKKIAQDEYNKLSKAFDERESDCQELEDKVERLSEERDQLIQDLHIARNLSSSGEDIESLMHERNQLRLKLHYARAQVNSGEEIQSLLNERSQLRQELNNTKQQLNLVEQSHRETQANYSALLVEIEKIKPEYQDLELRAATAERSTQTNLLLEAELNRAKNDLINANAEHSEAIEAKEQAMLAAYQALIESNSRNSVKLIEQLRKSIINLETEKKIDQIKITTLEADTKKIHKDHEDKVLSVQQNHQYIIEKKDAAIEGHQNTLTSVQQEHQEIIRKRDEMIQRLKTEASADRASLQEFVLKAKNFADASELEKNQLKAELDVAKNSVLEVQSSSNILRGDFTKLHTEIKSAKTLIAKTNKKVELAQKELAETAEQLGKEQIAHKESKKHHSVIVNHLTGTNRTLKLVAYTASMKPSNETDQNEVPKFLEQELVTPVRTRTLVRDTPSIDSLCAPDESDIALLRETVRSGLESTRADTKAKFAEEVKAELRAELVESIKVELREELVESIQTELDEAGLTSSTTTSQEIQPIQAPVMTLAGQEDNNNSAAIATSETPNFTFVHEFVDINISVNDPLLDGQTLIPVIVAKGKSLPRSKAYCWSKILIFLLAFSLALYQINSATVPTPGVVQLIDAPRPASIPMATINAPLFATSTTFQLAATHPTVSVQIPQVTTVAVLPRYVDYLPQILYRSRLIYLHRIVKVKSVVIWDVLKTSIRRVAKVFSRGH